MSEAAGTTADRLVKAGRIFELGFAVFHLYFWKLFHRLFDGQSIACHGFALERKWIVINLADGKCVTPRGDEPTLTEAEIEDLLLHVNQWQVKEVGGMKRLERAFKFKNFAQALEFTNKIGAIAEEQDHHPLIMTEWGKVTLNWWTHKIGGLHKNDFIMAAKTDELYSK